MKRHLRVACLIFVIHQTVDMLLLFSCGVSACWPETPPEKLVDLTNPRVSSSSPGPSSSFIFILTLGDNLFLLLLWSHEAHFTGTCIKIWGKITFGKNKKENKHLHTRTISDIQESQGGLLTLTTWLVSIATAGGWGGRVCLSMQPVFEVLEPCPSRGGRQPSSLTGLLLPPPLLPLPPLPAPF